MIFFFSPFLLGFTRTSEFGLYGCLYRAIKYFTWPDIAVRGKLNSRELLFITLTWLLSVLPLRPLLNSTQTIPYDVYRFHNSKSKPLIVWRLPPAEHLVVLFATRITPLRCRHNIPTPSMGPTVVVSCFWFFMVCDVESSVLQRVGLHTAEQMSLTWGCKFNLY